MSCATSRALRVAGVDAAELDEHADRAALVLDVLVAVEQAVGRLEADDAAELDLLAERARQALHEVVDGLAVDLSARRGRASPSLDDELRELGERPA